MRAEDFLDSTPQAGGISAEDFLGPAKQKKQNQGIAADLVTDVKRGVEQLPGAVTGLVDIPIAAVTGSPLVSGLADKAGEITGFQPSKWAKQAEAEYSPSRQAGRAEVDKAWEQGTASDIAGAYLKNPMNIVGSVAESLPSMLAGGLAGRAALGIGAAQSVPGIIARTVGTKMAPAVGAGIGEGGIMAGQAMQNSLDAGVDPRTAAGYAGATGLVGGALGALGGKVAQKMGVVDPETLIAGGVGRQASNATGLSAAREVGKRIAGGAISEGVFEELPQSVFEQGFQNLAQGKPLAEGMARAGVEGALAGSFMGGAFNMLPGSRYAQAKLQERPPEDEQQPIAGLLPAPRYPVGDRNFTDYDYLQANQAAIDAADKNAADLYAMRDAFEASRQNITLTTDPVPLQQRLDELISLGASGDTRSVRGLYAGMDDKARAQYEKDVIAALSEPIGIRHDANQREVPFTMGEYLDAQVSAEDALRAREKYMAQSGNRSSVNRLAQLAEEEAVQNVGIVQDLTRSAAQGGALSRAALTGIQTGATQMPAHPERAAIQQQILADEAAQAELAPIELFMRGRNERQLQNLSAPGHSQATRQAATAEIERRMTEPVQNIATNQVTNVQAGAEQQAAVQPDPQFDVSKRTDAQLANLASAGKTPEKRAAAVAELQRRAATNPLTQVTATPEPIAAQAIQPNVQVRSAEKPAEPQKTDSALQNRDRGRAASVNQMQSIARNPDYMRLGPSRTPDSGAPMVFAVGNDLSGIPAENFGASDVAVMADGQRVPFRYAVIDASRVQPSNFADGMANPAFASNERGTIKALNNGRTAGIRAAHSAGNADAYVGEMIEDGAHGVSSEAIRNTPNPMLVRVYAEDANTDNMAAKSQGQGLGMSASERAAQDAELMTGDVLDKFAPLDIAAAGNRDFVRAFVGKLPENELADMMDATGNLSQDGRRRIEAALLTAAYGKSDLVQELFESTDTDIKAIGNALKVVSGQWAIMRQAAKDGVIDPAVDMTGNLMEAVNIIRRSRAEGSSVAELAGQGDLMGGNYLNELSELFLRIFYRGAMYDRARSGEKVITGLQDVVTSAMNTKADAGLFGDSFKPTPKQIVQSARNKIDDKDQPASQSALFGANGQATAAGQGNRGEGAAQPGEVGQRSVSTTSGESAGKQAKPVAQQATAPVERKVTTEDARGQQDVFAQAKYAGPADVSSRAGQMELSNRAGTIAALKGMNEQLRKIAPDEAWADRNIDDAQNLDALRDQISQALVDANRGKPDVNPLRKELEELSGQELKDVFSKLNLAGKLMAYEERISALLMEDAAEVRAAISAVTGNPSESTAQPVKATTEAKAVEPAAQSAEQKIRSAFDALPSVSLGVAYPITVEHNGVKREFMVRQDALGRGKIPALHVVAIHQGRMIAADEKSWIAQSYKLNWKNELAEEGLPKKISDQEADEFKANFKGKPAAVDAKKEAETNDRDHFTLERLNRDTNQMEPVAFKRGEYVRYILSGNSESFGEIDGISHARREFSVDGLWYPFGAAYKAERPAEAKPETVPLSSVIEKVNAKHGEGLTDADRVPKQYNTLDAIDTAIEGLYDGTLSIEDYKAAFRGLMANKEAIVAELGKLTKDQLLRRVGKKMYGGSETKPELVTRTFDATRNTFGLRREYGRNSWTMGPGQYEKYVADNLAALTALVEGSAAEDLKAFADEIDKTRAARQEKVEAAKDPKTLEDFENAIRLKKSEGLDFNAARMSLAPEQRAEFDRLRGMKSRDERKARADQQKTEVRVASQTTEGQIIETKHTKTGEPLFVVKAAERVERDVYNLWNATAKRMGGHYSSFRGNGAVPGFQFKTRESADAFIAFIGGNAAAAKEVVQERRDSFADDKSQSAVERLNEMADRMDERADESLGRERKANTQRRARFAAAAEAAANAEKAMATTMRRIAEAIANGTAQFLDRVRQKAQIEYLSATLRAAKDKETREKYPSYADQEKHRGENPTAATADYAEFPQYTMMRSDIANLARKLVVLPKMKLLGQRILKIADDTSEAYNKFAKDNLLAVSRFGKADGSGFATFSTVKDAERSIEISDLGAVAVPLQIKRGEYRIVLSPSEAINRGIWKGDDRKITLPPDMGAEIVEKLGRLNRLAGARRGMNAPPEAPWQFENAYNAAKRLAAMGIENPWEFRAMLREFANLKEAPKERDKIKEMERAMIGRKNDGLDFFPTPEETAKAMIDAAEISEGMSVLEPSAGMGHIAEQVRGYGVDPDVIEFNGDRRELLEAKGFNVVGSDFLAMTPRGFTFGDVFRDKDGVEGIMRGSGGMGSGRVGFIPLGKDERQSEWRDRDELEGVRKNGINSGYDRIIMNPPFSNRRDAEHVQHAYTLLRPGGRIVAIMGEGVFFGTDKKAQQFRDWLEEVGGTSEKLDEGTFMDPSLPVNTATNARMVVINKPKTDNGVALYSMSGNATQTIAISRQQAESRIKSILGDKLGRVLIDSGIVTLVDTEQGLRNLNGAKYMVAWHGSPHDHNKFDSSKIGTGEGAQAYGYGLYFAGSRDVAEYYRDTLSGPKNRILDRDIKKAMVFDDPMGDGSTWQLGQATGSTARGQLGFGTESFMTVDDMSLKDAYMEARKAGFLSDVENPEFAEVRPEGIVRIDDISKFSPNGNQVIAYDKGKLYQVELAPSEDEYLDWDKPLSEQSDTVKAAIESIKNNKSAAWSMLVDRQFGGPLMDQVSGRSLYKLLAAENGDKAASDYLHSIGIRGIRYLDGNSRGTSISTPSWLGKEIPDSVKSGSNAVFGNSGSSGDFAPAQSLLKKVDEFIGSYITSLPWNEITSSQKDQSYSLIGNAKLLSDITKTSSFIKHGLGGLDIPTKRVVLNAVSRVLQNGQVLDSVIKSVPVDMMNMLGSKERSAKKLLNDIPVLLDLLSINGDQPVASGVNGSNGLIAVIANAAAKEVLSITNQVSGFKDFISTLLARDNWHNSSFKKGNYNSILNDEGNNYVIFSDDDVAITAKYAKQNGGIQGATLPDGRIALVLENLTKDNFAGVFQHEGFHSTIRDLVGEQTYAQLMKRLDNMRALGNGGQWFKDAVASVPAGTRTEHVTEEIAAYAVQGYVNGAKQPNVITRWVESLLSALRTAIIRRLPSGKLKEWAVNNIQPQDLANLAIAGLKAKARGQLQAQGREAMAYSKINQTDTPAFKKWFGDSKVVDADGKPLVVYHGTRHSFDEFMREGRKGRDRLHYFTEDPAVASEYAGDVRHGTPNVMPVYVSLQKPFVFNASGEQWGSLPLDIFPDEISKHFDERNILRGRSGQIPRIGFAEVIRGALVAGYDGVVADNITDGGGKYGENHPSKVVVAHAPEQIKSAIGNNGDFDPSNPDIRYSKSAVIGDSGRNYNADQRNFFKNVGREIDRQNVIDRTLNYLKSDFWKKMAVGLVDQFRGLRDLGDNGQAYMLARLSKGTAGAFDALLHHGKLSIRDGVYDADTSGGFIDRLGVPLHGELDDFLWYVAANRAEGLSKVDRENLFTPADIAAGKSLAKGRTNFDYTIQTGPQKGTTTRNRTLIYADANRVFNEFQKNTLDMAEQSGLIDGASRKLWESEFYVPFYRVSEEDGEFIGAKMGNALVRQQAFKKLKGGTDKLNSDLLSNTLLNFSHLIEASAKNRAAKAALVAAEKVGAAQRVAGTMAEYAASDGKLLPPGTKKTVWYMGEVTRKIPKGQTYIEGGVEKVSDGTGEVAYTGKIEYAVSDPFVMTAITSLEYAGMRNGVMDVMTKFKHFLTIGVTASPAFKVRNLIRDSIQSIGASELGYNPIKNITEGYKQTRRDSQEYVSALASGALIRFGTMLEGSESARVRQLVKSGVKDSTILNSENKWRAFYDQYLEPAVSAYNELGNRSEEINRAALYNQLVKQGKSHAEAALLARDLMDFSMQGSFNTIRFLTQVVPFMNARLQGMYKLGRAAKDNPRKLAVVTGAVAMASIALMLAYGDDDDWKRREDWDRDNFWWFKLGGIEFRIPKPFEIGAIATLAERGLELMIDDEMTGERFRRVVNSLAMNNLSMNPIPQAFKPILDLYANKDSFTGRPIESMGMERLDPTERFNSNTTMVARGLSSASLGALSPVQFDHLTRSYFGWLGSFVIGGADMAMRAMSDEPTKPALDYFRFGTQGILKEAGTGGSRYVTQVYEQAKELEQAHATWRQMLKDGRIEEAKDYAADNRDKLIRYRQVEAVKRTESNLNERIRRIERSDMDSSEKKNAIALVNKQKEAVAMRIAPGIQYGP